MNKTVFIFDKPLEKAWKRIYSTWEINNKYQFLKSLPLSLDFQKNTLKQFLAQIRHIFENADFKH